MKKETKEKRPQRSYPPPRRLNKLINLLRNCEATEAKKDFEHLRKEEEKIEKIVRENGKLKK